MTNRFCSCSSTLVTLSGPVDVYQDEVVRLRVENSWGSGRYKAVGPMMWTCANCGCAFMGLAVPINHRHRNCEINCISTVREVFAMVDVLPLQSVLHL